MPHTTSTAQTLAQENSAKGILVETGSVDNVNWSEGYQALINEDDQKLQSLGFKVAASIEVNQDIEVVAETAKADFSAFQKMMENYAEYIKLGIIVLTTDCTIDGDVNTWDMDKLAIIGFNTQHDQVVDGKTYRFDEKLSLWESNDGSTLAFDLNTGLPEIE